MTDLINNTTAMPAVLWTDWMNSSRDRTEEERSERVFVLSYLREKLPVFKILEKSGVWEINVKHIDNTMQTVLSVNIISISQKCLES